ncbi:MAG: hypothetical protein JSU05_03815 [Bacteroidetes bacterium]|nr:hypothetical protein [Bacteroidota bacterium]
MNEIKVKRQVKAWIIFFMISLALSGITAMPLETELNFARSFFSAQSGIGLWLNKVYTALSEMNIQYPFLAYGYDWLAFAHLMLAILFVGPLRDPVKNKWVIEFGMIACISIIPFAFIAGVVRAIPFWWTMIDCSFGIFGLIPLQICLNKIKMLEKYYSAHAVSPSTIFQ